MAIGLGLMIGFRLPRNFDSPYQSQSITEFWRRWHISLSSWLRDYLYVPLGGNRHGRGRTYANLMLTMLLGGLWHGAAWTFVLWGAYQGALLALERACGRRPLYGSLPRPARIGLTFVLVLLGWTIFRAESFAELSAMAAGLFGLGGVGHLPRARRLPNRCGHRDDRRAGDRVLRTAGRDPGAPLLAGDDVGDCGPVRPGPGPARGAGLHAVPLLPLLTVTAHPRTIRAARRRAHLRCLACATLAVLAAGPAGILLSGDALDWPTATWDSVRDGSWARATEDELTDRSPVATQLRGAAIDARYRLGLHESELVVRRPGGWLFSRSSLFSGDPRNDTSATARAWLRRLAARCRALDVEILALPVPDRWRIYPDRCFDDGRAPAALASRYRRILADFEAAGVDALDLAQTFAQRRRERPLERLFYQRDTHWTTVGALLAAQHAHQRLAQRGPLSRLGPPAGFATAPPTVLRLRQGLTQTLGLRADGAQDRAGWEDTTGFYLTGPTGPLTPGAEPEATVALCGDSFGEALKATLPGVVGRTTDCAGVLPGEGPFAGLLQTLSRIAAGQLRARAVIWVFVERSRVEGPWDAPRPSPNETRPAPTPAPTPNRICAAPPRRTRDCDRLQTQHSDMSAHPEPAVRTTVPARPPTPPDKLARIRRNRETLDQDLIQGRLRFESRPRVAELQLSNFCNMSCTMCYDGNNPPMQRMSPGVIAKLETRSCRAPRSCHPSSAASR